MCLRACLRQFTALSPLLTVTDTLDDAGCHVLEVECELDPDHIAPRDVGSRVYSGSLRDQGQSVSSTQQEYEEYMDLIRKMYHGASPPRVKTVEWEIESAVFAMPAHDNLKFKRQRRGMHFTGIARVSSEADSPTFIRFCSCSPEGEVAWDMVQHYHDVPCSNVNNESCECIHSTLLRTIVGDRDESVMACLHQIVDTEPFTWKSRIHTKHGEDPDVWYLGDVNMFPLRQEKSVSQ